jgi:hypothetical protein
MQNATRGLGGCHVIEPVDPDASEAIMRITTAAVDLPIYRKQMYPRRPTILRD